MGLIFVLSVQNIFLHALVRDISRQDTRDFIKAEAQLLFVEPEKLNRLAAVLWEYYDKVWLKKILEYCADVEELKIPKNIHFIWLGNSALPQERLDCMRTWEFHHPDWNFFYWDEELLINKFPNGLENQSVFDQALKIRNYGKASDIARYEILKRYGGLYVDSDARCFRNFGPLHTKFNFYCGCEGGWKVDHVVEATIGNAVVGSTAGHPICDCLLKTIRDNHPENYFEWHRTMNTSLLDLWAGGRGWEASKKYMERIFTIVTTGPGAMTRAVADYVFSVELEELSNILIAPDDVFYHKPCVEGRVSFSQHLCREDWLPHLSEN